MSNHAQLTEGEIAELKKVFYRLDMDGDGKISAKDLEVHTRSLGLELTEANLKEIITEVDADSDGTVDLCEFIAMMALKKEHDMKESELKQMFCIFDKNRDGVITAEELQQAMVKMGDEVSDEEVEEMIREVDTDGDGVVSYPEFKIMMSR